MQTQPQGSPVSSNSLPLPEPATLFPPCRQHDFFSFGGDHGPLVATTAFQVVNACWLADASLLAYDANEAYVRAQCLAAGYSEVQWVRGRSSQALLMECEGHVVLAFRGTQVVWAGSEATVADMLADWITDARTGLTVAGAELAGEVHDGFKAALDQIWQPIIEVLQGVMASNPGKKVWLTGHSLGAAMATLAAVRLPQAAGLYTFGSPMVGDAAFCRSVAVPSFRIVHQSDVITSIPWFGMRLGLPPLWVRYAHAGTPFQIDEHGVLRGLAHPSGEEESEPGSPAMQPSLAWREELAALRKQWAVDSFYHHSPLYYALRLRQNLTVVTG